MKLVRAVGRLWHVGAGEWAYAGRGNLQTDSIFGKGKEE